jgi:7-cyano-7-deazaguanine reductase
MSDILNDSPLGKTSYVTHTRDPDLLYPVARVYNRELLGFSPYDTLPFKGCDILNAYELSWLDPNGKPQAAMAQFILPHSSPCLIESKSLKLYLHSLNNTVFEDSRQVQTTIEADLSQTAGAKVTVILYHLNSVELLPFAKPQGICLDELDFSCSDNNINPTWLETVDGQTKETVYSHLFRSLCPVTGQPDWATIRIHYQGGKIEHGGLLRYLVSFRRHQSFHEHCIEHIFMDLWRRCQPKTLTVIGLFTRRGGIDINPYRSNEQSQPYETLRHVRQ